MDGIIIEVLKQEKYHIEFNLKNVFIGEANAVRRVLYDCIEGFCLKVDKIKIHKITTIIEDFTKEIDLVPVITEKIKGKDLTKFRFKFVDKDVSSEFKLISTSQFQWTYDGKTIEDPVTDDFVFYGLNPGDSLTFEGGIVSGIGKEHAKFSQVKHINYKPTKIDKQYRGVDLYDCFMSFSTYSAKPVDDIMGEIFTVLKEKLSSFRTKIKLENEPTIEKQMISTDDMKIIVKDEDATLGGLIVPNVLIQQKGIFIGYAPIYYGEDDLQIRIGSINQRIIEEAIEYAIKRINSLSFSKQKKTEKKKETKEKEKKTKKKGIK